VEVQRELQDRFGPPPPAVANLLDYAILKALAEKLLVRVRGPPRDQVAIKFYDDTPLGPERLVKLIRNAGICASTQRSAVAGWKARKRRPHGGRQKRVATATIVELSSIENESVHDRILTSFVTSILAGIPVFLSAVAPAVAQEREPLSKRSWRA